MMNEKHDEWKTWVDHPIASVDDLGAYDVAHGNFFQKNSQVAILNKELANDSLYMRSLPQNVICPPEASQAMISLDKFDMRSAVFDSFLTSKTLHDALNPATYTGWSKGFVMNILLLAAFKDVARLAVESNENETIISTKTGRERAHNIKPSAYLIFVNRSWWSMAMLWCPHYPFHFRKPHSKAALKSIRPGISPRFSSRWIWKSLPPYTAPVWEQ